MNSKEGDVGVGELVATIEYYFQSEWRRPTSHNVRYGDAVGSNGSTHHSTEKSTESNKCKSVGASGPSNCVAIISNRNGNVSEFTKLECGLSHIYEYFGIFSDNITGSTAVELFRIGDVSSDQSN
jgi:hypothetical protein